MSKKNNKLKNAEHELDQLKAFLRQETIPFIKNLKRVLEQNGHNISTVKGVVCGMKECIQELKSFIKSGTIK